MKCPACGHENLQGDDFCGECSTPLTETQVRFLREQAGEEHRIQDQIHKVSVRDPVVVTPTTSVKEVVRLMREKHSGCALIVDNDELLGIFTERDALHRIAKPEIELEDIEIQNVMTPSPEVLKDNDRIALALNKMAMGNYRHVPMQRKEDGSYYVFSVRDLLRYFF